MKTFAGGTFELKDRQFRIKEYIYEIGSRSDYSFAKPQFYLFKKEPFKYISSLYPFVQGENGYLIESDGRIFYVEISENEDEIRFSFIRELEQGERFMEYYISLFKEIQASKKRKTE